MGKNKSGKDAHYKEIISKQKKIIQKLQKQAGRAGKIEHRYADLEERQAEYNLELESHTYEIKPTKENECPKCSKEMDVIEGSRRKVFVCHNCGHRASTKGST